MPRASSRTSARAPEPPAAEPLEATAGEAGVGRPSTGCPATVVLDTCVLLSDPDALFGFGDSRVVLPLTVIEELDAHKSRRDDIGRAARASVRSIEELREEAGGDLRQPVTLPTGGSLQVALNGLRLDLLAEHGLDPAKADNRIMAAALGISHAGAQVKVVSADASLRIKAAQLGLAAEDYRRTRSGHLPTGHVGWRHFDVPAEVVDAAYENGILDAALIPGAPSDARLELATNEGAVLRSGSASVLMRRRRDGTLARLDQNEEAWGLRPRSKEQRFALSLLKDPQVPVVALSGHAGTGKTVLALAAGLEQVFEPACRRYDRLMVLRPVVPVGRADVGFLPGTLEEKLGPWMEAVVDAIVALGDGMSHREAREMLAAWMSEGRLTMESVTFLRGRSLQNTYVLLDEAQNVEPLTVKTVLTRLGNDSKLVMVGDLSQIDTPYISDRNCGLSVVTEAFWGSELFGHVMLTKGERSLVADLASERL